MTLAAGVSQPLPNWPERIGFTVGVLIVFALLIWSARRAWVRRAQAHADLLPLPVAPDEFPADLVEPSDGLYVGSTQAGGWQERVYAGRLGNRAAATFHTTATGVLIERDSMPPLFVPAAAIRGVRLDAGLANKVVGGDGLIVVTWEQNGYRLDSGFRADHRLDNVTHLRAIENLIAEPAGSQSAATEPALAEPVTTSEVAE